VPIILEYMGPNEYRTPRIYRNLSHVMLVYETNETGTRDDATDIFQFSAEIASAFSDNFDFAIVYDQSCTVRRIVCFYPGPAEGFFRINSRMIPVQVATKILHLAARVGKRARRGQKESKHPGIARLKKELRSVRKLLKNSHDPEQIATLNATRETLIADFLELVPPDKRSARLARLENKLIHDKVLRRAANANVTTKNKTSVKKEFKKTIDSFRAAWRECRDEERQYDFEQERERIRFHRERGGDEDDDSEEVEDMYKMFKTVKAFSSPEEDIGEIEQRLEIMEKLREKRHQRQKQEGKYRPRDAEGNYMYDDPNIRVGVDDPTDLGLDPVDLSPIKRKEEKEKEKQKEKEAELEPEPFPGQFGDLL
jgi:hypothetical protein